MFSKELFYSPVTTDYDPFISCQRFMTIMNQLFRNAIVGNKIFQRIKDLSESEVRVSRLVSSNKSLDRFINVHDSIKKKETYSNKSLDKGRGNQLDSAKYKASFKNEYKKYILRKYVPNHGVVRCTVPNLIIAWQDHGGKGVNPTCN